MPEYVWDVCVYLFIYYVKHYLYWIILYVKKKFCQAPGEAIQLSIVHIQ